MNWERAKNLKIGQKVYYIHYPNIYDCNTCSLASGKIKKISYSIAGYPESGMYITLEDDMSLWHSKVFTSKKEAIRDVKKEFKRRLHQIQLVFENLENLKKEKKKIEKSYNNLINS